MEWLCRGCGRRFHKEAPPFECPTCRRKDGLVLVGFNIA